MPGGDHTDVVRSRRPEVGAAGVIVEKDGTVLGEHDGIDRFTVGQRKGLGVAAGRKRFVLEIVPETNTVVVGDAEDLLASGLVASRVNWLADVPHGSRWSAPRRSLPPRRRAPRLFQATVADGGAIVHFREPQPAVTPGQAVTFYAGHARPRRRVD